MINLKNIQLLLGYLSLLSIMGASLYAQAPTSSTDQGTFRLVHTAGMNDDTFLEGVEAVTIPDDIKYQTKEGEVDIKLGSSRLSRAYTLPQSQKLELYRWLPVPPDAPEGTKPEKQILAQIPLAHGEKQIVFTKLILERDAPYPIHGIAVDDLDENHLPGQARLINLSSFSGAMALEEERAKASPKTSDTIFQFAPGMTDIIIAIEINNNGKWAQTFSNRLRLNEKVKVYALIYNHPPTDDNPLPVRAQVFTERVRPPQIQF